MMMRLVGVKRAPLAPPIQPDSSSLFDEMALELEQKNANLVELNH